MQANKKENTLEIIKEKYNKMAKCLDLTVI